MTMSRTERNVNIDIVKCLAILFVVSVHFLLNINFTENIINTPNTYVMCGIITICSTCVPLFLLTT